MQPEMNFMELVQLLLQFAVLPLAAFMWAHYKMTQNHQTEIAVMKSEYNLTKEGHDRELKEIKTGFSEVLKKLDEIQKEMRK